MILTFFCQVNSHDANMCHFLSSSTDSEHSAGEGDGSGCQPQSGRAKPGHEAPSRKWEGATGGEIHWTGGSEGEIQTALCPER